ncbi:helix-turn-helix domain-containing protein [Pseudomonas sp. P2663]
MDVLLLIRHPVGVLEPCQQRITNAPAPFDFVGVWAAFDQRHHDVRRLGSICTGAIALAEAGLLDGRRATTHWCHAPALQKAYPKVKVEEDRIFINDGNIWTAAGMRACVDLALALVEKDLGAEVARQLVVYHRRAGGFSRVFHAETGQSPAKAIENLRVEAARLMMETGRHPIDVVATDTGFGDRERMRRAFIRAFGQPSQVIQRANRG